MKWIILIAIAVLVGIWLARGRMRRSVTDPEAKLVEKQDYYVQPPEESRPEADHKNSKNGDR